MVATNREWLSSWAANVKSPTLNFNFELKASLQILATTIPLCRAQRGLPISVLTASFKHLSLELPANSTVLAALTSSVSVAFLRSTNLQLSTRLLRAALQRL